MSAIPDDERKALIAELYKHPGLDALRAQMIEWRNAYYANLGQTLYSGAVTLAESDLDFKRGYFKGMATLLNETKFSYDAIQRDLQRSEVNEVE